MTYHTITVQLSDQAISQIGFLVLDGVCKGNSRITPELGREMEQFVKDMDAVKYQSILEAQ